MSLKDAKAIEEEDTEKQCAQAGLEDLQPMHKPATIPKTEERSITLPQLKALLNQPPRRFFLYECVHDVVMAATRRRGCRFVELVAHGPQPPTWFVTHWWGEAARRFLLCLRTHAA